MVDFTEAHRARMIETFENAIRGNRISKTRTPRFGPVIDEDNKLLEQCIEVARSWATAAPKK